MIILGIDPGFSVTGFGIMKKEKNSIYLLDHGDLRLPTSKSLSLRVGIFFVFLLKRLRHGR